MAVARAASAALTARPDVRYAGSVETGASTVTVVLLDLGPKPDLGRSGSGDPDGPAVSPEAHDQRNRDAGFPVIGLAVRPIGDIDGGAAVFSAAGWPTG